MMNLETWITLMDLYVLKPFVHHNLFFSILHINSQFILAYFQTLEDRLDLKMILQYQS